MDYYEVVTKLIGPVDPVGATHVDDNTFENLKELTHLVDKLLDDIERVSSNKTFPEYSMKRSGQWAWDFLKDVETAAE